MKTPTKDKSSMPDVIWATPYDLSGDESEWLEDGITLENADMENGFYDTEDDGHEYSYKYTLTETINAQLDEIINGIDNSLDDGDWHGIKRYLTKLKEMRGA
jgi:hypothetical protein